jgi:hypothetical protein
MNSLIIDNYHNIYELLNKSFANSLLDACRFSPTICTISLVLNP